MNVVTTHLRKDRVLVSKETCTNNEAWIEAIGNDSFGFVIAVETALQLTSIENIT